MVQHLVSKKLTQSLGAQTHFELFGQQEVNHIESYDSPQSTLVLFVFELDEKKGVFGVEGKALFGENQQDSLENVDVVHHDFRIFISQFAQNLLEHCIHLWLFQPEELLLEFQLTFVPGDERIGHVSVEVVESKPPIFLQRQVVQQNFAELLFLGRENLRPQDDGLQQEDLEGQGFGGEVEVSELLEPVELRVEVLFVQHLHQVQKLSQGSLHQYLVPLKELSVCVFAHLQILSLLLLEEDFHRLLFGNEDCFGVGVQRSREFFFLVNLLEFSDDLEVEFYVFRNDYKERAFFVFIENQKVHYQFHAMLRVHYHCNQTLIDRSDEEGLLPRKNRVQGRGLGVEPLERGQERRVSEGIHAVLAYLFGYQMALDLRLFFDSIHFLVEKLHVTGGYPRVKHANGRECKNQLHQ